MLSGADNSHLRIKLTDLAHEMSNGGAMAHKSEFPV